LGAAVFIDVSGDTNVSTFSGGTFSPGRCPVHAVAIGSATFVVNRDDGNVATFSVPIGSSSPALSLIGLPPPANVTPAQPAFVASAGGKVFVAESALGMVADISSNQQISVGPNPVALVATPDGTQLFSLNRGDNSVSVIRPATDQVLNPIPLTANGSPAWGTVSSDGSRVFVVNDGTGNNVSVINTATDTVASVLSVGAGPNYIVYQASLNRAYVTSPASQSLSIIDNNLNVQTISLAGAPCNAQHPISVTALADGSRVYVADDATNSVCILNTSSNTFTKRICLVQDPPHPTDPCPVGATPVFIASDSDSTRVYTANQYQTAAFGIASISRVNDKSTGIAVVTVTTTSNNPFVAGQSVTIAGVNDSSYVGRFGIATVVSSTQFTYVQTGLPDSTSSGGTAAILPNVSIIRTSDDTTVKTTSGGSIPLTIDAGGTPTFIAMTL
jgi:YVTN family beta-propeller protein